MLIILKGLKFVSNLCGLCPQVSPVGLREDIPMVVTEEVAQLPHMWLGGGEPDLKLGMPVPAFLGAYHAAVVDCSDRKRTVEDT